MVDITPEDIINPSKETYKAKAICDNCDYRWPIKIEKGVPVWIVERKTKCPHCGSDDVLIKAPGRW